MGGIRGKGPRIPVLFYLRRTIVLLVFGVLALGCGPQKPWKILYLGVMTGPNSALGVDGNKGVQLALGEINKAGGIKGRQVEIHVMDDGGRSETGLSQLQSIDLKLYDGVILHTTSGASVLTVPYLMEKKVLTVSRTVSSPQWSGQDDFFIRFAGNTADFGAELGKIAKKTGGPLGFLYESTNKPYGEAVLAGMKSVLTEESIMDPVAFESWGTGGTSELLEGILTKKPKAIVAVTSGPNGAKLAQELAAKNLDIPLLMAPWAHNQVLADNSGPYAPHIIVLGTTDPGSKTDAYGVFLEKYRLQYNQDPSNFAIFGYEVMSFLAGIYQESTEPGPEGWKKTALRKKFYQGLQNRTEVDGFGDASYYLYNLGIKDGQFYLREPAEAP